MKNDYLKLIALLSMLIDHIGMFFLADYPILYLSSRLIGRISFPIFAFYISQGYIHTGNLKKYYKRLFIISFIAQIPYSLLLGLKLNIIFTLLFLGLLIIDLYTNKKYISIIPVVILSSIIPVNYGFYGVLLPLIFYVFREKKTAIFLYFVLLNLISIILGAMNAVQMISLVSLIFIFNEFTFKIKVNKYFFYAFYPVHLMIIYIIILIFNI